MIEKLPVIEGTGPAIKKVNETIDAVNELQELHTALWNRITQLEKKIDRLCS